MLLLCLAQVPLLGLNLGSKPASAQAEQDLLWNHDTGNVVDSVSISSDGNYIAAGDTYGIHLFSRGAESISGAILWTVIAVIVIGCSVMIYKLRQHQRLSVKRRGKRGA